MSCCSKNKKDCISSFPIGTIFLTQGPLLCWTALVPWYWHIAPDNMGRLENALRPPSAWAVATSPRASWRCQSPSRWKWWCCQSAGKFSAWKPPLSELPLCSTSSCLGAPCQHENSSSLMTSLVLTNRPVGGTRLQSASEVKAVFLSPAP